MYKTLAIATLGLIFSMTLPRPSWAETVVEKIVNNSILKKFTYF
ncbi:hypothetical protein [Chlorogloeopsis fritschii]|nr:hypothetical protein [Chlorogloeopsis fritschii]